MSRGALRLLILATVLVFGPLVRAGFVFDDAELVAHNRWTDQWSAIPRAFAHHLWASAPSGGESGPYYRPLMLVSLVLDKKLLGGSAAASHLHSLAWHVFCISMLARLLAGLGRPGAAALACAVFALHPVMLEPVAFIAARNDILACAALLGVFVLLEPRDAGPWRVGAAALGMLTALLCKESALAGLPMALVLDRARYGRFGPPGRYLALLAAVAAWVGLRAMADITPLSLDLGGAARALGWYAGLLVWPIGGSPAAELAMAEVPWERAITGLGLVMALAWRGGAYGRAGLAMALLALAPGIAGALSAGFLAHRYLYLPMAGLAIAVFAATPVRADRPLAAALGLLLALGSASELRIWANNTAFFARAWSVSPSPRNACGVFKALEREGSDEDPTPWLRLGLEPPPSETCCFNATRWPLETGRPDLAVALGALAIHNGCALSPELIAPMSMALALTGDWDAAERYAGAMEEDPWGYTPVVRAAAALRRGEAAPTLDPRSRERVDWLMRQGP